MLTLSVSCYRDNTPNKPSTVQSLKQQPCPSRPSPADPAGAAGAVLGLASCVRPSVASPHKARANSPSNPEDRLACSLGLPWLQGGPRLEQTCSEGWWPGGHHQFPGKKASSLRPWSVERMHVSLLVAPADGEVVRVRRKMQAPGQAADALGHL